MLYSLVHLADLLWIFSGRKVLCFLCLLLCVLFSAASPRKQGGHEEGEDNDRDGVDLGAGWCRKEPLLVRSYNLVLCLD